MLFEDMSWMDVERHLERDDRVVVVTGACEQHGYLSLLADIRIPLAVAREACKRE
ncbi:MAG TPA: creatininase family protein, partial [Anaerolineae bacterium]|nr:creatininase family protein [Anaerolineae bacterium]